jgi:type I site-specific restriction-modification system R (restriction) subunit
VLRIEAAKPDSPPGKTDTSEKGLETVIFSGMAAFGWIAGDLKDYDRDYAVELVQLTAFLEQTQKAVASELHLGSDNPERRKLLARLQAEITSRGVIHVLRHGVNHGKHELTLFYGNPSQGNPKAAALFAANRFSITRQLRYSRDETRRALDLCLFINGLPVATFELKNSLTKQTVEDAVEQYRRDRDPRELLFKFGRTIVHFAMDDIQVTMCTELKGKASWFLPFNQGWNDGAGKRYLIQHSAGSGKSNSIAWLAHQLIGVSKDGKRVFDSIIVITDRRILDEQIQATIKDFAQVSATVGHATHSGDLRRFIESGKKIIISTVQKFPFILDEIGDEHRTRNFAIIIDEAHSSQGGKTSAALSEALADPEDEINDALEQRMAARKLLDNASYFAFTATPKNKTLEIFGDPFPREDGKVGHRPFHSYTMKQAIQEGFILDVLKSYTPVDSYYRLVKTVESDPEFDTKRAQKKLRLRGEPRPCHSAEGRDHGRPFPGERHRSQQDRQSGPRDGGNQRHCARDPVLPRISRISGRAEESVSGDRPFFGGA